MTLRTRYNASHKQEKLPCCEGNFLRIIIHCNPAVMAKALDPWFCVPRLSTG